MFRHALSRSPSLLSPTPSQSLWTATRALSSASPALLPRTSLITPLQRPTTGLFGVKNDEQMLSSLLEKGGLRGEERGHRGKVRWLNTTRGAKGLADEFGGGDGEGAVRRRVTSMRNRKSGKLDKGVGSTLIPALNKLQEILQLLTTQLDLPQIVVVGGQSSGKSSVLESMVGHDFLPRGSGIVTRRPIILQLNKEEKSGEWGEFAHLPDKKFHDFDDIRDEINRETERLCGANKGISADPIILRIFSPHVIPLTLVDTPGLTRLAVGDQPKDIERMIRDLVFTYIKPKNAIILAVHSATQDLATSEAMKIAREVDPDGQRTIGVLTKLDLMDRGTDATRVLLNELLPLRHGYVGVKNRSQQDITSGKTLVQSNKESKKFFEEHSVYRHLHNYVGMDVLSNKCNRILSGHIKECLPQIRQQIRVGLEDMKKELAGYGTSITHESEKRTFLLNCFSRFAADFDEAVSGHVTDLMTDELSAGARIRFLFYEDFVQKLQAISPTEGISMSEYRTAIRNAAGPRPALFIPDAAFALLVKKQIEKLREPSLECADLVISELIRIITNLDDKNLKRFPALRTIAVEVSVEELQKRLIPAKKMINDLIDMELAYINTNHPDFFGGTKDLLNNSQPLPSADAATPPPPAPREHKGFFGRLFGGDSHGEPQQSTNYQATPSPYVPPIHDQTLSQREQIQVKLLKMLITKYFEITVKNLQDYVIKALWQFLINGSKDHIYQVLVSELYNQDLVDSLCEEAPYVQERRAYLTQMIATYEKANSVLMDVELRHLSDH